MVIETRGYFMRVVLVSCSLESCEVIGASSTLSVIFLLIWRIVLCLPGHFSHGPNVQSLFLCPGFKQLKHTRNLATCPIGAFTGSPSSFPQLTNAWDLSHNKHRFFIVAWEVRRSKFLFFEFVCLCWLPCNWELRAQFFADTCTDFPEIESFA